MSGQGLFAEGTETSPEKSQQEIVATLRRYGADGFYYGEDSGRGAVAFRAHGRMVRFTVPLDLNPDDYAKTPGGIRRKPDAIAKAMEAEHRRRWRALALAIKAKLEVVATGIASFEDEFLANIVLPGTTETMGEWAAPHIDEAYRTGAMPALLPGETPRALTAGR